MDSVGPGEFEIIEKIRELAEGSGLEKTVRLGIGDDCCILENDPDSETVLSIDTVVEDIHFRRAYYGFFQIGGRAVASALSDLAAMAAYPIAALSAVSIPKNMAREDIEELARGMVETAASYGCPLLGGDITSSTGGLTVTVTVVGSCAAGKAITRSGAKPGDEIWVSGYPGTAAAVINYHETRLRDGENCKYPEPDNLLSDNMLLPRARIDEAQILADSGYITSMIDISDGLAADLGHILERSNCGADIIADLLPVSGYCAETANFLDKTGEDMVLYGGEDYELCFTASPGDLSQQLISRIDSVPGASLKKIGTITETPGEFIIVRGDGSRMKVRPEGFDHFKIKE